MESLMIALMRDNQAPPEAFARLDIDPPGGASAAAAAE
jgi:hypothetical protein